MICFVSDIWYHFVLFYLKLYCTHIDTCCTMHKSFKKVHKIWNYFLNRYSLFMLSVSVGTGDICYIRNLWIRNEIFSFLMQFFTLEHLPWCSSWACTCTVYLNMRNAFKPWFNWGYMSVSENETLVGFISCFSYKQSSDGLCKHIPKRNDVYTDFKRISFTDLPMQFT